MVIQADQYKDSGVDLDIVVAAVTYYHQNFLLCGITYHRKLRHTYTKNRSKNHA